MAHYICLTCGAQFAPSAAPPDACPICQDERQYIGAGGQQWITLPGLQSAHHNILKPVEADLIGISTHPEFAIGQRALLVQTPGGNVLWDCISLIDAPTIAALNALGGVQAIAISHPHFYSSMVEFAHAFAAPIYLHAADQEWVMRPDPAIRFWEGEALELWEEVTLIRAGGHFTGGTVLHWAAGAEGRGILLTSDILTVVSDRRYVSFMRSYPNLIPLPEKSVSGIVAAVEPYAFDRIYGGWWPKVIEEEAKTAVHRSAARYIAAINGRLS
jgi:hypothetical protein